MRTKRRYVRDRNTGELGYLSSDGSEVILDRGNTLHRRRFETRHFVDDEFSERPLSPAQMANGCWDVAMSIANTLSIRRREYREWRELLDETKAKIIQGDVTMIVDAEVLSAFHAAWDILIKFRT